MRCTEKLKRPRIAWCLAFVLVITFLLSSTTTSNTHTSSNPSIVSNPSIDPVIDPGFDPLSTKNGTKDFAKRETLAKVVIVSASVSLLGGIFVMISAATLFSNKLQIDDLDLQISQIVFCLSITDMIFSVNLLLEGCMTVVKGARWRDQNVAVCSAQGFVNQFCMLSIVLWNLAVGVSVFRSARSQSQSAGKRQWLWLLMWATVGWGIPLLTGIYGLARDLYGPSAGWCWVVNKKSTTENAINHWIFLYGPIFIVLCVNTVLYIVLAIKRTILVKNTNFNFNRHQFDSSQSLRQDSAYEPYELHEEVVDRPSTASSPSIASVGGGDSWRAERCQNSWIVVRLVAFITVFILSWSGGAFLYACVLLHVKRTMGMLIYYCISVPLGGFFNAMVYSFLWVSAYRTWSCCRSVQSDSLHQPLDPGMDVMFNGHESFGGTD